MTTYNGKYTDSGNNSGGNNVLSDARLVKKQSGSYGDNYERFSIGRTVSAKQKRPGVQDRGNVQNGQ